MNIRNHNGEKNPMFGKKHSELSKQKMREKMMGNKKCVGRKLSDETKKKIGLTSKGRIPTEETRAKLRGPRPSMQGIIPLVIQREGQWGTIKRGWYDVNGKQMFFRSKWEVNYALFLDFLKKKREILDWQYEADVFVFEKIKFGTRSYRPDFKIFNNDGTIHYDEVKGYMDAQSKTKINRMRIYYPEIKLNIILEKDYNILKNKMGGVLHFY